MPEEHDLPNRAKFIPTSDESPVSFGSHIRGRGNAWQHVASITIPVGVREMCGSLIGVLGQECLEIRAKIIVLVVLRDCGAIENDVTLTEERVEEFIGDDRVVRNVHTIPRTRD